MIVLTSFDGDSGLFSRIKKSVSLSASLSASRSISRSKYSPACSHAIWMGKSSAGMSLMISDLFILTASNRLRLVSIWKSKWAENAIQWMPFSGCCSVNGLLNEESSPCWCYEHVIYKLCLTSCELFIYALRLTFLGRLMLKQRRTPSSLRRSH